MITGEEREIINRMKDLGDVYCYRDFTIELKTNGKLTTDLAQEFIDFLVEQIKIESSYASLVHYVLDWHFVDRSKLIETYLDYEDPYTIVSNLRYYSHPSVDVVINHFIETENGENLGNVLVNLASEPKYHKYITVSALEKLIDLIDADTFVRSYHLSDNIYALSRHLYYTLNPDFEPCIADLLKKIIEFGYQKDFVKYLPLMKKFNLHGLLMFK